MFCSVHTVGQWISCWTRALGRSTMMERSTNKEDHADWKHTSLQTCTNYADTLERSHFMVQDFKLAW